MRNTSLVLLFISLICSCSVVEQKPQIVQVNQSSGKKENWNKMMSGIKLETEQAIHLAVLRVESNNQNYLVGPNKPNGLIIDGEALLVPNKILGIEKPLSSLDWEMTIGFSQMVDIFNKKEINFFVFCFKKNLCPLINEKMITLGISPKRLVVGHVDSSTFSPMLNEWLKTHSQYLFVGDDSREIKKVLSKIDDPAISKRFKKGWINKNFVNLPDARSRVAQWHQQSSN